MLPVGIQGADRCSRRGTGRQRLASIARGVRLALRVQDLVRVGVLRLGRQRLPLRIWGVCLVRLLPRFFRQRLPVQVRVRERERGREGGREREGEGERERGREREILYV